MTDEIKRSEYKGLLKEIKERIHSAQYAALRTVNKELLSLYWDIGRMIVERQKGKTWGKSVVERLAADLQKAFPGVRGFSGQNLWRMKSLYEAYYDNEKLSLLTREIGWTQNYTILGKCKDNLQREFYLRMTRKFGWTVNVLIHQIENQTYEKTLLSKTSFDKTLPEPVRDQAKLALKDEYLFDFLELGEKYDERQLEEALLSRMEAFLREMGGLFLFAGSQYRLDVGGKEYFIDFLLYHRHLRCLVALELKVGEFKPEYVGKMQFYLAVLDEMVKTEQENDSIGIILCKSRSKTMVEYALRKTSGPMGVAQYTMVNKLPPDLEGQLPSAEQVERLLGGID
ncbi:MAG: PDDEXK nuclease domain-containing protein [Planctomycetota bacterium]|jgi:predicted nuclease of restriction endonuclease-like (RecB) superfamily